MCGIAGIVGQADVDLESTILAMTRRLSHRGPDASGIWLDRESGVALGHARLAIVELSDLGAQPMVSSHGRYVTSFNGEIYNFKALANELRGDACSFRGASDTEVMLAAFERWGIEGALSRFNGMFAIAVWDRSERKLVLIRDRLGKKPLYYGWTSSGFLFASELKAFREHPGFKPEIDRESISIQLRHNYIPAPWSIYRGVFKVPPGAILVLSPEQALSRPVSFQPEVVVVGSGHGPRAFWSLGELAKSVCDEDFSVSDDAAISALEALITDSVRQRMVADVPLGAFLSGGIDSSLIVALMQRIGGSAVETFSVGFEEPSYNEAANAASVAAYLGTKHHELRLTPADALEVVPQLPYLFDEPFSDSSQIPTFIVSHFAKRSVTVALSGDGGDECFCGYNRYAWAKKIWQFRSLAPWPIHDLIGGLIRLLSPRQWDKLDRLLKRRRNEVGIHRFGHRMHRLADFLQAEDPAHLYQILISHWETPGSLVLGCAGTRDIIRDVACWNSELEFRRKMMLVDQSTYLPGDILTKVDRASMGVSLEVRAPLLDYRVVEMSWKLPLRMLSRDGDQKWILKQILYKHIPRSLVDRPKMGFGVPIQKWLAGPLREWASDLLSAESIERQGYLNADLIQTRWREFLAGGRPWDQHLWDVLMFQAWLINFHQSPNATSQTERAKVLAFKRAG